MGSAELQIAQSGRQHTSMLTHWATLAHCRPIGQRPVAGRANLRVRQAEACADGLTMRLTAVIPSQDRRGSQVMTNKCNTIILVNNDDKYE